MTTSLHPVETQPEPPPDADLDAGSHMLTNPLLDGLIRQVWVAVLAGRARGDTVRVEQETTETSWSMTFLVARR